MRHFVTIEFCIIPMKYRILLLIFRKKKSWKGWRNSWKKLRISEKLTADSPDFDADFDTLNTLEYGFIMSWLCVWTRHWDRLNIGLDGADSAIFLQNIFSKLIISCMNYVYWMGGFFSLTWWQTENEDTLEHKSRNCVHQFCKALFGKFDESSLSSAPLSASSFINSTCISSHENY